MTRFGTAFGTESAYRLSLENCPSSVVPNHGRPYDRLSSEAKKDVVDRFGEQPGMLEWFISTDERKSEDHAYTRSLLGLV